MGVLGYLQSHALDLAPKFIRQPNIARLIEAAAFMMDTNVQTLAEGFKLSNPLLCDVSAFPSLSKDRKIRLYPTEPEASKRYRLSRWRQIRRHDASAYGAMLNLQPYFYQTGPGGSIDKSKAPLIRVVHQSGDPGSGPIATWHTMSTAGAYTVYSPGSSNFNYDGRTTLWSRWWAFVDLTSNGLAAPNLWDDGHTYNDGALYDGTGLTTGQASDIVSILIDSNPPHAWLAGVFFIVGAGLDITAAPVQDVSGWWSLPSGAGTWGNVSKRPPYIVTAYDNPVP